MNAGAIIRPGDVLLIGCSQQLTHKQTAAVRDLLMARLPALADVIVMSVMSVEGVYRDDDPQ